MIIKHITSDSCPSRIKSSEKLFLYERQKQFLNDFCFIIFVGKISQKVTSRFLWNFHTMLVYAWNRYANLFSVIVWSWRHLDAILWFCAIIHIFITNNDKITKFCAHKLQIKISDIMSLFLVRASSYALKRASKFLHALIDPKIILGTFWTISSISKISARTRPRARFLRA